MPRVPLHHRSDGPPPPAGEDFPLHHPAAPGGPPPRGELGEECDGPPTRFGRGWIPVERDIGLPSDEAGFAGWAPHDPDDEPPRPLPSDTGVVSAWVCPATGGICRKPSAEAAVVEDGAFVSHHAWDAGRKVRFLHHLSEKGDVRAACARVGMSRQSAYVLRRRDAAFAQGWQAALVLARGHAEEVLATRALDGVEEAVWFRGELVGKRQRYDTRLLLAHLGRLDRLAGDDESAVQALAGRFDEALAVIAGEDAAAHLGGEEGLPPRPVEERHAEEDRKADPLPLPPDRAEFVRERAEPAFVAANEAWIDAAEEAEAAFEAEHGFGVDDPDRPEGLPDPAYPPAPEYADFHAESGARWDGWQGHAFGRVDGLLGDAGGTVKGSADTPLPQAGGAGGGLANAACGSDSESRAVTDEENATAASGLPTPNPSRLREGDDDGADMPPMEYKSLYAPNSSPASSLRAEGEAIQGGLRGSGLPRGFTARKDEGPAPYFPLDRVNRVNLSTRRAQGTAERNMERAGNAMAGLGFWGVKAGAVPPPTPSHNRVGRPFSSEKTDRYGQRSGLEDQVSGVSTASSTMPRPRRTRPIWRAAASDRSITRLP